MKLGIVGHPVSHSLSPVIQQAALRKAGIPGTYRIFPVPPRGLRAFVREARRQGLAGFSVTIPHKEAILPLLDRLSPEARLIGAVNTVVLRRRGSAGYNTDAAGYLRSLREARFRPKGKQALILGAGGAARAVLAALASAGIGSIAVCNRTPQRGARLVRHFRGKFRTSFRVIPLRRQTLEAVFPEIDLLVNATSVGLRGTRFRAVPLELLRKSAVVSDIVYRPRWTPLLRAARKLGLRTHSGIGMLLHQGAISFRLWTGRTADLKAMKRALLDGLCARTPPSGDPLSP